MSEQTCEACWGIVDGDGHVVRGTYSDAGDNIVTNEDVRDARICLSCANGAIKTQGWRMLYDLIRANREAKTATSWEHRCGVNSVRLTDDQNCMRCGLTFEQAKARAVYLTGIPTGGTGQLTNGNVTPDPEKAVEPPFASAFNAAVEKAGEQMRKAIEAMATVESKLRFSAPTPPPTLEQFTAAIETHLVPRLPARLRVVTDTAPLPGEFALWVLDENGRELKSIVLDWVPARSSCQQIAASVAEELMRREVQTQKSPP